MKTNTVIDISPPNPISGKGFFKVILSFWVCVARHAQITQNNKFATSLQYLKKEVSDEIDFLHGDNHESLPDTMNLIGRWSSISKVPQIARCDVLTISQKRSSR